MTPTQPRPSRIRARWWAVVPVLALAAAGLWYWKTAGPGSDTTAAPASAARAGGRYNLVVITLDTTRADHLGAYGSTTVKTPVLDALAREGVLFDQAMTAAPLTLPAHCSIFTGRFPPEHGARDNGGFFLAPDQVTMAEVLKARGYQTGAFVAAYVLDSKWGLDQGFDTYVDDFDMSKARGHSSGSIQRPANEVIDKALPWMESAKDQRFFAWIHLYDPHTPYAPPEPYKTEYAGHPYRGEIAFTDAQIGRVVEFLRSKGLLDTTVIAVMGDHGESLGDHGEDGHGFFVYESVTRVPLMIRAPGAGLQGKRVTDPVRLVDVMPTALELLGVETPGGVSGASLMPLMTGKVLELGLEGYAEAMYPLHHYGWSDLRALRSGRFKAIDAPRPELYDVQDDPGETRNIYGDRRTVGDQMIARLRQMDEAFRKVAVPQTTPDVDPEVRERLAALGYVGSFVADANDTRTDRADPKDKIRLFNLLSTAREAGSEKGGAAKSAAIYRQVLAEDPNVIDAWFSLGTLASRERQYREAITHFSKALSLKPDYDLAVINIALAYRNLGDDEAALAGFERYLALDPKDPYVRCHMGEVYLDRGDFTRAEAEFTQALGIDPHVASAINALGAIALRRGDLATAEQRAQDALKTKPDVRLAHYNLALIAEQRGDLQLAEKEYLLELEQHPDAYRAAFNLSRLYAQIGEKGLEVDALQQTIDGNPDFSPAYAYLAKARLDAGAPPAEAVGLARKSLSLAAPKSDAKKFAHVVLAEAYSRQGRAADSARELAAARAIR